MSMVTMKSPSAQAISLSKIAGKMVVAMFVMPKKLSSYQSKEGHLQHHSKQPLKTYSQCGAVFFNPFKRHCDC